MCYECMYLPNRIIFLKFPTFQAENARYIGLELKVPEIAWKVQIYYETLKSKSGRIFDRNINAHTSVVMRGPLFKEKGDKL